jgi:hypothetical protein
VLHRGDGVVTTLNCGGVYGGHNRIAHEYFEIKASPFDHFRPLSAVGLSLVGWGALCIPPMQLGVFA